MRKTLAYSDPNPILIIDPGHGGKDPGTSNASFLEKNKVLEYSLYMLKRCRELNIPVGITRIMDEAIEPNDRANMIKNSGAKFCISNHINAAGNKNARGFEVIHSIHSDGKLANNIYKEITKIIPGRRVFTRSNSKGEDFYFMHRLTGNVSTLIVEYGFATNDDDTIYLLKDYERLIESVLRAFCSFIGVLYVKPNEKPIEEKITHISDDFMGVIEELFEKEILNDKNYWLENAHEGKFCKGDFVKAVLFRTAQKLNPKEILSKPVYQLIGNTHIMTVKPLEIDIFMTNHDITNLSLEGKNGVFMKPRNIINGSFFWYKDFPDRSVTVPNSIIVKNGTIISDAATHAEKADRTCPQSVIIIRTNGKVEIQRIKYAHQIPDLKSVKFALGGLGIVTPYGYSPNTEGFYSPFNDVLRQANKTFIGYSKKEDLIYLMVRPDSTHDRIIQSCKNLELDFAISLDGGGSSSMIYGGEIKLRGDGRRRNNYIVF